MPIQSFQAQSGIEPNVLVLGSIPGITSLNAQQYYAHPRNAFWSIMCEYFDMDINTPYPKRVAQLLTKKIALWDVLAQAERQGSLDSAIVNASQVINPIDEFARTHSSLQAIFLNGGKAASSFKKAFSSSAAFNNIDIIQLPSTSPAYAAMPKEVKRQHWHQAMMKYLVSN